MRRFLKDKVGYWTGEQMNFLPRLDCVVCGAISAAFEVNTPMDHRGVAYSCKRCHAVWRFRFLEGVYPPRGVVTLSDDDAPI